MDAERVSCLVTRVLAQHQRRRLQRAIVQAFRHFAGDPSFDGCQG